MHTSEQLSSQETLELRSQLNAFIDKTGLGVRDIARGADLAHNTISQISTGTRSGSKGSAARLAAFMQTYKSDGAAHGTRETQALRRSELAGDFVMTRAAAQVLAGLDHCVKRGINGVALGDPGTGKTRAVEHWSAVTQFPHLLIYCRAYTTYASLVRSLGRALGLESASVGELDDRIHEELAVRPKMLILDEADMLAARTLDWLRTIWDSSDKRSLFFLTAKPAFYERMQTAHARSRNQDLRQLWRRIAFRKFIAGIERDEMDQVLAERGWAERIDRDAAALLYDCIGHSFGELEVYLANIDQILEENRKLGGRVTRQAVELARNARFGIEFSRRRS